MENKETPEEAAEILYPTTIDSFTDTGIDMSESERLIFIAGAKWQQERMYSEEEVLEILTEALNTSILRNDIVSIPKWFEQFSKLKNG